MRSGVFVGPIHRFPEQTPVFHQAAARARSQLFQRGQTLQFQHRLIRKELEIHPVIRIVRAGDVRCFFTEHAVAELIADPDIGQFEAQLGRAMLGALADLPVAVAEGESRIAQRRVRPEGDIPVRQKVLHDFLRPLGTFVWVRTEGRLWNNRRSTGSHHGERPRGDLQRLVRRVVQQVLDRHAAIVLHGDMERLLVAEFRHRGSDADRIVAEDVIVHRHIIHIVAVIGLGSRPEAVTATDAPLGFSALADLLRVFLEDVLATDESVADEPRTHFEGDDQFDAVAANEEIAFPAVVIDFFDHEKRRVEG